MRLYVGSLPFSITEDQLRAHFARFGEVVSATITMDKATGRSRGFGFVTFNDDTEGRNAINATNGVAMGGRSLKVYEAPMREVRDGRFGCVGGYWKN